MDKFTSLGLPQSVLTSLEHMKFITATPIQKDTIPPALEGRDILGSAPTGTGKTGAFSIPMIVWLLNNPEGCALVMTPTRELASQVQKFIQELLHNHRDLKTALLIGGDSMYKQKQQLMRRPRIFIGTPGRINDHLNQNTLNLSKVGYLVLDETDRMLDMGFRPQIKTIIDRIAPQHQTLLFTATLLKDTLPYAKAYLNDAVRVEIGSSNVPVERIKQETIQITEDRKYSTLLNLFDKHEGSIIIFSKTKHGCDRLAMRLQNDDHKASAIHGDLNQRQRDRVISSFRDKRFRILVATDVAARGLDIPHITCVVNYDMPQCPEDYIHRIGRTGRAGADGHAVNFVTGADSSKWRAIQRLIDPNAKHAPMRHGGGSDRNNSRRRSYDAPRSASGHRRGASDERSFGYNKRRESSGDGQNRHQGSRSQSSEGTPRRSYRDSPRSGEFSERNSSPRDSNRSGGFSERSSSPRDSNRGGSYSERNASSSERKPQRTFQSSKKSTDSKWQPRAKKTFKAKSFETA